MTAVDCFPVVGVVELVEATLLTFGGGVAFPKRFLRAGLAGVAFF